MNISTVGVVGTGTMGNGIAQVLALFGHSVVMIDIEQALLDRARERIAGSLAKLARKKPEVEPEAVLARLTSATELEALAPADFVIEAVPERLSLKHEIFQKLDAITRDEIVLATNTSSISITKIAATTKRADKVIGMHFMNPVPIMKLVEVIRGHDTSDPTTATTVALATKLQKTPVEVADSPGFVSNRVLLPMINEAIFALYEQVATAESIDTVMKLGMAHPMGPLTLADFIGLDVCLAILEVLYAGFGDPKYRACPLLRRMVDAGHLGRKTGRGFFTYDS